MSDALLNNTIQSRLDNSTHDVKADAQQEPPEEMTLDELKRLAKSSGSVAKFADAFKMLEQMEQQTAELAKQNAEMRENLEKAREHRHEQDAIKALQADVAQIKANTSEPPLTKEQIMAVKDTHKRLELIRENMHLFKENLPQDADQIAVQNGMASQYERIMAKCGVTADMSVKEICDRMPSGMARQYAIRKSLERAE